MRIDRLNVQASRGGAPAPAGSHTDSFSQLVEGQVEPQAAADVQQAAPVAAHLDLPPMPQTDEAQDREARKHGGAVLRALNGLQLSLLDAAHEEGRAQSEALQTLSALIDATPAAADPALAEVLKAIAQRAAVELARAG